jgi:hypothetical protein
MSTKELKSEIHRTLENVPEDVLQDIYWIISGNLRSTQIKISPLKKISEKFYRKIKSCLSDLLND